MEPTGLALESIFACLPPVPVKSGFNAKPPNSALSVSCWQTSEAFGAVEPAIAMGYHMLLKESPGDVWMAAYSGLYRFRLDGQPTPLVGLLEGRKSRTEGSRADEGVRATFWLRRCCSLSTNACQPEPVLSPTLSRQQLQGAREARTNADCAEVTPIAGQNPVDVAALGDGGNRPVDKPQSERFEPCVKLQGPGDIGRERQLVFIARRRVKHLSHQFAHRFAVRSKEVVHLRKNKPGHDDGGRRSENFFVIRKARLATGRPGKRPEEAACIGDDRRDQSSMSRKSSDSSPSLLFVDSNRSVEGGRRPE
jgi:hypothetical protein